MELKLERGDYVPDIRGGLCRLEGDEALLQRVLFRLTARRGKFPFWPTLGSRLFQLGQVPAAGRKAAAAQYVAEALEEEDLSVQGVTLEQEEDGERVTAELVRKGHPFSITVKVH